MVSSSGLIRMITDRLSFYGAKKTSSWIPHGLDQRFPADQRGRDPHAQECLLPLAALATPNIPEAEVLSGMKIENPEQMQAAAEKISLECGCAVLC